MIITLVTMLIVALLLPKTVNASGQITIPGDNLNAAACNLLNSSTTTCDVDNPMLPNTSESSSTDNSLEVTDLDLVPQSD